MRNPTIVFARPRPESTSGEPIELSVSGDMQAEFGSLLHWPDPRTGPSDRMSSRGFVEWLCGRHTNLERNILIEGFVRHLRKAANREITMFFKTAEPPALRIEIRLGRIAETPPAFVPAMIVPEAAQKPRLEGGMGPPQWSNGRMVIELGRGRRVVVDGSVDADALARVLDALDRR